MRVAYIGNFGARHSTETHIARALECNGVDALRVPEKGCEWGTLVERIDGCDFVLWTTTYDFSPPATFDDQRRFLDACPVPTVGYHLDLWWGLDREPRIFKSPFFRVDLLCTADGGHDEDWLAAGINHQWMPPAVSAGECAPGEPRDEYRSPVIFVGSWEGSYHAESTHRHELVRHLRRRGDCTFWPRPGEHSVRNEDLRDLYASASIAVGDSCMVPRLRRYWSDRIPESTGRGIFLLHPEVEGLREQHPHLVTWQAGDWSELDDMLDHYLAHPDERAMVAARNRAHTLEHHTYEVRMRQLVALMQGKGLL